jgi:crotonobetainyl-CoA:carnitine CoA-transferase CaiB-like acyl-CoA transferase
VGNDSQFRKFAQVAGQPQWADDPRFATNKLRVANRAVLIPLIRQATVFKTTAEWVSQLEQVGVPCGPINDLAQVFADPQVQARGLAIELPHPLAGKVPQVGSPMRLSQDAGGVSQCAASAGRTYGSGAKPGAGMGAAHVAALKEAGVI